MVAAPVAQKDRAPQSYGEVAGSSPVGSPLFLDKFTTPQTAAKLYHGQIWSKGSNLFPVRPGHPRGPANVDTVTYPLRSVRRSGHRDCHAKSASARLSKPWDLNAQESNQPRPSFRWRNWTNQPHSPVRPKSSGPYSEPGIYLGTSSFTAAGWEGTFYPPGTKSRDFLSYYATQFNTVEVDNTFYGTPIASTVTHWYDRTPPDFLFAVKVPQIITHEKVLLDCEAESDEFLSRMDLLREKLGPMLLQFPRFDKYAFNNVAEFLPRLHFFLKRAQGMSTGKFAVEIRNKSWLDARFADALREYNVALVLNDTSFVPRPWEMKEQFDLVTADFLYVRWLGDRKGIEKQTTTWDKPIIDRQADLRNWVDLLRRLVTDKRIRKLIAYANNHYAGHAPATVKSFWDLWNKK